MHCKAEKDVVQSGTSETLFLEDSKTNLMSILVLAENNIAILFLSKQVITFDMYYN